MDKLKQYIDNHREEFDDIQMPEGHFDRFSEKLKSSPKTIRHRRQIGVYSLLLVAGIALFLLIRFSFTISPDVSDTKPVTNYTCGMREEINDLQLYYSMQMNELVMQMKTFASCDLAGSKDLLKEMSLILYDNSQFEQTVLPGLPCSNAGIFAMNQHYNASIEALQLMLNQLEQMK